MLNITRNPQKKGLVYIAGKMSWGGEASPFEDVTRFPDAASNKAHEEKMHDKKTRGLKNWVSAHGGNLDSINTPRALTAWYDDYPTPYNMYDAGDDTRAIKGHYKRMVPKREATENEIKFEELYREYGDRIETVLMPQLDKHGHVYTPNQPLPQNIRAEVKWCVVEIDYLGIPKEGKGKNKREKGYWIGKVYLANKNIKRYSGDTASDIAAYFGVSRRAVFNYAKYARACDAIEGGHGTQKDVWFNGSIGTYELTEFTREKMVKPWENPDNYGGKRGAITRAFDAKSSDLRN